MSNSRFLKWAGWALVGLLACAGPASADVSIGRADTSGSHVTSTFIKEGGTGSPGDIAVSGNRIYWLAGDTISRARLDGSHVDPGFIANVRAARGLTADSQYLYWGGDSIGRVRLDGTALEPNFMRPSGGADDVVAQAPYLYWTSDTGIGRANLDGTAANSDFIDTGVTSAPYSPYSVYAPFQLAVNPAQVFWVYGDSHSGSSWGDSVIGSANVDGSGGIRTVARSHSDEYGDRYWSVGADDNRLFSVVSFGLAEERIDYFDLDTGGSAPGSWPTSDERWGPGWAGGLAVGGGSVYWTHETDRELHCDPDYSHSNQLQSGSGVHFEMRLTECEPLTGRVSGRATIAHKTYKLKRRTVTLGHENFENVSVSPKSKDRRQIVSALKRGRTASARIWLRVTDEAGNAGTLTYGVQLTRDLSVQLRPR